MSYVCEDGLKINAFCEDGKPCYEGKSPSGHIWWDICNSVKCRKEETLEEDYSRRQKKKSTQQILKEGYQAGDPEVDLLGELSGKFDYYVLYPRTRKQKFSPFPSCKDPKSKEDHDQNLKPPLIPYYQKVLPRIVRCQPFPTSQTHS